MKKLLLALLFLVWGLVVWPLRAGEQLKVIETYQARLSPGDHRNAKGQRLTTPAAILRRDRERNDPGNPRRETALEDNPCAYFNSAEHRAELDKLLASGHTAQSTYEAILRGTPLVEITLYGTGDGQARSADVKFIQGGSPVVEE